MHIRGINPDSLKENLEILGITTVPSMNRSICNSENKRLKAATDTIKVLKCIPECSSEKMGTLVKMLGLSKISYGWVGKQLPAKEANKLATSVYSAVKAPSSANVRLNNWIFGGTLHPSCMAMQNTMASTFSALNREGQVLLWRRTQGSVSLRLRNAMKSCGWQEKGEWEWSHPDLEQTIQLDHTTKDKTKKELRQEIAAVKHVIREAWRRREYASWQKQPGRYQQDKRQCPYVEGRVTKVRRRCLEEDGTGKAVLCGAVRSPASVLQSDSFKADRTCIWPGCEALGTIEHIAWDCNCRPAVRIPKKPSCRMQARMGWPIQEGKANKRHADNASYNEEVLHWLKNVAEKVWDRRYNRTERPHRSAEAHCYDDDSDHRSDHLSDSDEEEEGLQ